MESLSSTSGSSKRARAPTGGNQVVSCLVDGCKSDLSKCRDYHRRHKVCELHSKTPKVTIGGREQRFCQQCSRFHSLGEFDEGKRSCRKRLEGHNRRRRKPQPDSLPVKPGSFLSGARAGSRFMPFSSSPMIPASSVVNSTWSGSVKVENSPTGVYSNQSQIDMLSYSTHPLRGRQFPFLQLQGLGSALMIPGSSSSSSSSCSSTTSATGVSRSNNHNHNHNELRSSSGAGAGGIRINQGIDSALSLLSSSSHHTAETRLVPQAGLVSGLHYNSNIGQMSSSCPHQLHLQGGSPHSHSHSHSQLMPISSNLHHCQDVFPDGSCSVTGPQQTVSFLWE